MEKLVNVLDDGDTFLIKLPHKFKDYLQNEQEFTLTKNDAWLGHIIDTNPPDTQNENETLQKV